MSNSNNKFITARPSHGNHSRNQSHDIGTSLHLRSSAERQNNLQAYGFHLTKCENLTVNVDPNAETASIKNYADNDGQVIITIPTFEHDDVDVTNPFPDLTDEEFFAALQYAEMIHEGGHYEHTDQPSALENFRDLEQKSNDYHHILQKFLMKLCKNLWNAIEDGAMEEAIRNERGAIVAQRLAIKNETFIAQSASNYPVQVKQNVSFDLALHVASIDLAKYDTGSLRRLLDEEDDSWQFGSDHDEEVFMDLYPELRQTIEDAMTIPNPAVRTNRIFDFLDLVLQAIVEEIEDIQDQQTAEQEREQLQNGQPDDTENQSGPAQTQNSEGLQQNDPDNIAQQHANVTQQTVTRPSDGSSDDESDSEADSDSSDDGDAGESPTESDSDDNTMGQSGSGDDESESSGEPGDSQPSGSDENSDSASGSEQSETGEPNEPGLADNSDSTEQSGTAGSDGSQDNTEKSGSESADGSADDSEDSTPICPACDSENVGRLVQHVDGMIAARVNAPFDITADWVDSITFVLNNEVCGFRVRTSGAVPEAQIEENGYKVVDVSNGVEVLEPRSRYGDTEPVNGFECESCGHAWVPTIGGDPV